MPLLGLEPSRSAALRLSEVWEYRELLYFFVWRNVKVRYKQTAIGAAWAIIQPLLTMIIFTLVFRKFANVPSDGLPYPIFSYAALLPLDLFCDVAQSGYLERREPLAPYNKDLFPPPSLADFGDSLGSD